jgi:hypothetical protein
LESPTTANENTNDKPFVINTTEVYIVQSWESPDNWNETKGNTTRTIHVYSNAPFVELLVDGTSQGMQAVSRMVHSDGTYAEWLEVPWKPGNLTAVASSNQDGPILATSSKFTNTKAAKLILSLDAPSPLTGTGDALFLVGKSNLFVIGLLHN